MLAVTLTISTLVSIMFFFVGGVVGWLAKEHVYTNNFARLMVTSPNLKHEK